jgi:two-component system response regulator HydG
MVQPSCPVFVVHDDDAFRKSLIATLDQKHFTVTYAPDGEDAVGILRDRTFRVVLLGIELKSKKGIRALEYIRDHREAVTCAVIILGDPDPEIRSFAPWADETLLKPVDAEYIATRARTYCGC